MCRVFARVGLAGLLLTCSFMQGEDRAALSARLQRAAQLNSIDDPTLKPWHLKLAVQLFNGKGRTAEQGTVEEWWTSGSDKRTYSSPSYNATEIVLNKTRYRTTGQPTAPYMLDFLRDQVVHPVAQDEAWSDSVLERRTQTFGKASLDCILLNRPVKNIAFPPLGMFPAYCLARDNDGLRISYGLDSEQVMRNTIGFFQGRRVPTNLSIMRNGAVTATAHIEALSSFTQDEHFFDRDASVQLQTADPLRVSQEAMSGTIIKKVLPLYPVADRQNHTSGSVLLRAVVGIDGHIVQLSVINAPSPGLAASALSAVREWVYKPYMLNGVPAAVDTTIVVHFNFSPT